MKNHRGFTIIELLIATTVFSVVLLVITSALILAGRVYFKGVVSVRTQEVARQIADDISQNIQFAGGQITTNSATAPASSGICIGNRQYSYILGQEYKDTAAHKFVVSTVSSCGSSNSLSLNGINLTSTQQELLGNNMRLTKLNIQGNAGGNGNLYSVEVGVAYGDDDVFDATGHCTNADGSQFCAKADILTTVDRRVTSE